VLWKIKLAYYVFRLLPLKFTEKLRLGWTLYRLNKLLEEMEMKEFLESKKVKGLIIGIVSLILVNVLGLPEAQVSNAVDAIMALVGSYLIAQGAADLGKGKAQAEEKKNGEGK